MMSLQPLPLTAPPPPPPPPPPLWPRPRRPCCGRPRRPRRVAGRLAAFCRSRRGHPRRRRRHRRVVCVGWCTPRLPRPPRHRRRRLAAVCCRSHRGRHLLYHLHHLSYVCPLPCHHQYGPHLPRLSCKQRRYLPCPVLSLPLWWQKINTVFFLKKIFRRPFRRFCCRRPVTFYR